MTQQKWERHLRSSFLTEIGAVSRDVIDSYYDHQNQKGSPRFEPIGVPQVNGKFQCYRNQTHLVGFVDGNNLPMTMEFYVDHPFDSPLANAAKTTYDHPLHNGDDSPFYVASTASGGELMTTYHHDKKGWCHVIANTSGQPTLMTFTKPMDDVEVHYIGWTRYSQGQDELPCPHHIRGSFHVQVLDDDQPRSSREAEVVERLRYKFTRGIQAHVTYPNSLDLPEAHHLSNYEITRPRWSRFSRKMFDTNENMKFKTDINGFLHDNNSWALLALLNPGYPKSAAAVAVILDYYFPTVTAAHIDSFIKCCGSAGLTLPPMAFAIQMYHHHDRTACTSPRMYPIPAIRYAHRMASAARRGNYKHDRSPMTFQAALDIIKQQPYPLAQYAKGTIEILPGPAVAPELPPRQFIHPGPQLEEDWPEVGHSKPVTASTAEAKAASIPFHRGTAIATAVTPNGDEVEIQLEVIDITHEANASFLEVARKRSKRSTCRPAKPSGRPRSKTPDVGPPITVDPPRSKTPDNRRSASPSRNRSPTPDNRCSKSPHRHRSPTPDNRRSAMSPRPTRSGTPDERRQVINFEQAGRSTSPSTPCRRNSPRRTPINASKFPPHHNHWKRNLCLTRESVVPTIAPHLIGTKAYKARPVWRKLF